MINSIPFKEINLRKKGLNVSCFSWSRGISLGGYLTLQYERSKSQIKSAARWQRRLSNQFILHTTLKRERLGSSIDEIAVFVADSLWFTILMLNNQGGLRMVLEWKRQRNKTGNLAPLSDYLQVIAAADIETRRGSDYLGKESWCFENW